MSSILIGLFTLILIIVCLLLVLVILMQRPNANSGMGASLGGGAAEGIFGGETTNVLTKTTVKLCVLFFVISAGLYLGYVYSASDKPQMQKVPSIVAVAPESGKSDAKKSNPLDAVAETKTKAENKSATATVAVPAKSETPANSETPAKSAAPAKK